MARVLVYPNADTLADAATGYIQALIRQRLAEAGRFALALSGGSTPRKLYERMSAEPYRQSFAWDQIHFFWGDERAVPPDHPDSNYRLAQQHLLDRVPVPGGNVHRMQGEAADLDEAAQAYDLTLAAHCDRSGDRPRLDLILLGLGPDGHTASLFPGSPAVAEAERGVVATPVAPLEPHVRRLTLTLPIINRAAHLVMLVSGASKAKLIHEILSGAGSEYPAAQVEPEAGSMVWMLDAEAANALGDLPEGRLARSGRPPAVGD